LKIINPIFGELTRLDIELKGSDTTFAKGCARIIVCILEARDDGASLCHVELVWEGAGLERPYIVGIHTNTNKQYEILS